MGSTVQYTHNTTSQGSPLKSLVSSNDDFVNSECLGEYELMYDLEGELYSINKHAIYQKTSGGKRMFIYKNKYDYWTVGSCMGKTKREVLIKSYDPSKESLKWISYLCPCGVNNWQTYEKEEWKQDDTVRLLKRRMKFIIEL